MGAGMEGGRVCGRVRKRKPTGNFAKVPKFSHLCGSSRKQENECSQGDQEVEKVRKKQENWENAEEGLSFSGFKSWGSDVKTHLHIEEETSTRPSQQQRSNKDSQASVLVLWSEDRGRNRGEGGEEKEEIGRGMFALEVGCFPYSCIWRTEEESIIWDHLRSSLTAPSIQQSLARIEDPVAMKRPHDYSSPDSDTDELIDVGQEDSYWWGLWVYIVLCAQRGWYMAVSSCTCRAHTTTQKLI